jgi:hypothetical protein
VLLAAVKDLVTAGRLLLDAHGYAQVWPGGQVLQ